MRHLSRLSAAPDALFTFEAVSKCFPLTAGFKIKEGKNFNHRNTLRYFEDYNLSLTQILGKRGRFEIGSLGRNNANSFHQFKGPATKRNRD